MTAKVIGEGFYERHGFVIVPQFDLRLPATSQVIYPRNFTYEVVATNHWAQEWGKVDADFWEVVDTYFPRTSVRLKRITVQLTRYGTIASSDKLNLTDAAGRKRYYLRCDAGLEQLAGHPGDIASWEGEQLIVPAEHNAGKRPVVLLQAQQLA